MKIQQQAQTANNISISLDGVRIGAGVIQNFSENFSTGLEPLSGIGQPNPVEHDVTMVRHVISMSMWLPRVGKLFSGVVPANAREAIKGYVFDVEVYDNDTGAILRRLVNVSYDSGNVEVRKHAIIITQGTFYACDADGTWTNS